MTRNDVGLLGEVDGIARGGGGGEGGELAAEYFGRAREEREGAVRGGGDFEAEFVEGLEGVAFAVFGDCFYGVGGGVISWVCGWVVHGRIHVHCCN